MAQHTFKCPQCDSTFVTEDELNEHTERVHPMSPVPGDDNMPEDPRE